MCSRESPLCATAIAPAQFMVLGSLEDERPAPPLWLARCSSAQSPPDPPDDGRDVHGERHGHGPHDHRQGDVDHHCFCSHLGSHLPRSLTLSMSFAAMQSATASRWLANGPQASSGLRKTSSKLSPSGTSNQNQKCRPSSSMPSPTSNCWVPCISVTMRRIRPGNCFVT